MVGPSAIDDKLLRPVKVTTPVLHSLDFIPAILGWGLRRSDETVSLENAMN